MLQKKTVQYRDDKKKRRATKERALAVAYQTLASTLYLDPVLGKKMVTTPANSGTSVPGDHRPREWAPIPKEETGTRILGIRNFLFIFCMPLSGSEVCNPVTYLQTLKEADRVIRELCTQSIVVMCHNFYTYIVHRLFLLPISHLLLQWRDFNWGSF